MEKILMAESEIKITDDSTIKVPKRSDLFSVENKDWQRIKGLITELSIKSSYWENAGWFFLATTVSFIIAYLSLDPLNNFRSLFSVSIVFSLFITVILFLVNRSFSKNSKTEKRRILSEMDSMEPKKD